MAIKFFFDTYALVEIVKGNQKHIKYLDSDCCTTILNLYELYFRILREFGKENAEEAFKKFRSIKIEINDEDIPEACEFKLKHNKNNLSYVDALGYIIALNNGFKFLTGDKEFETLENVEFVK